MEGIECTRLRGEVHKILEFIKPKNYLGDVGTDGMIILKWILHKRNMKVD